MFFSSPELSKTDSLHLSGIPWKPLFIWLSGILSSFDICLQIPKDRCFFWVRSCQKPTLYIFLESLRSRFLYDFQALLSSFDTCLQFRKMDGFTEFGVVQNRLFTSFWNLSWAAFYMTCRHFEHVLIHASNSERQMFFSSLELSKTDSLSLSEISQKPLVIWLVGFWTCFDTYLQTPKDRCFFRVGSCQKPSLYTSPKSPGSRLLYDL